MQANLTALQLAAKKGHTEVVELLIKAGAAVDVGDQVCNNLWCCNYLDVFALVAV